MGGFTHGSERLAGSFETRKLFLRHFGTSITRLWSYTAMRRAMLKEAAKRFPWAANVTLYGGLFAGGDFVHQVMAQKEHMDWKHTRNVAIVAVSFHGNFNYFWLRALEARFPGKSAAMVFRKLLLDQSFASPLATSVFYTGVSVLEGKEDVFEDWRDKFFNTWRTGLMYWPFMQFLNFVLMPLHLRTAFMGCCAFLWATFLCFSRQDGDGTAGVALAFLVDPRRTIEEINRVRIQRKLLKKQMKEQQKEQQKEEQNKG